MPVGLRNAWFSAVGLFLGRKIENFTLTKCFYFSILHTPAKFQASWFNNKRKSTSGGADPLNVLSKRKFLRSVNIENFNIKCMRKYIIDIYHRQKSKWYPQRCLLAHFEATLYFSKQICLPIIT